jgi:hypothetical protein
LCVLLAGALSPVSVAAPITVTFSLLLPNSSFPSLGEEWQGNITYDSVPDPTKPFVNYPLGYPLLGVTGTRTV